MKNAREKTPVMLAEQTENAHSTTILRMALVAKEETNHETRAAFLASMRECDHAIKSTTIAKDLPAAMRHEHALEHGGEEKAGQESTEDSKHEEKA